MKSLAAAASLVALFTGLAPSAAVADARAVAYVQDERHVHPIPPAVVDPVEAMMVEVADSQFAFALANQNTGVLRAVGDSGYAYPYLTTSDANASFSEVVTFSGGFGQTAYLDYSFEGSLGILAPTGSPAAAYAQMSAYVATLGGSTIRYEMLSAYAANCGPNCVVGTSTMRTGTVAFTIFDGPTTIATQLLAFASFGNSFDFGNTAKFYLRTPEGVTFHGANGFLEAATPIFAVPEPATYALMLAGLGALVAIARQRRAS